MLPVLFFYTSGKAGSDHLISKRLDT